MKCEDLSTTNEDIADKDEKGAHKATAQCCLVKIEMRISPSTGEKNGDVTFCEIFHGVIADIGIAEIPPSFERGWWFASMSWEFHDKNPSWW